MPDKRSKPANPENLINDLHNAVQAYVEGNGGKLWVIGQLEIVPHKATSFDLVIPCVGQRPTFAKPSDNAGQ